MYVSIRRYRVTPDTAPEIARRVNEDFLPFISKASGFVSYFLLNTGKDRIASVSVFQDQMGAEESNRMAADWVRQNIDTLVAEPPEITAGVVLAHKMSETHRT